MYSFSSCQKEGQLQKEKEIHKMALENSYAKGIAYIITTHSVSQARKNQF